MRPARPEKPRPRISAEEAAWVRSMVVFEDAAVLALDKPPGLSSQGGRAQVNTLDELLYAFARPGRERPRLVHRLDRDTSGLILTAKTKPAAGFLGKAMMGRRFAKTYLALVGGGAGLDAGMVDTPLRREEVGREAYMRACAPDHPDAEPALTRYEVLARAGGGAAALLRLAPETGRMHQLRVHLAGLGCPILGDARYGGALAAGGAPVPRLMLHAAALGFPHPDGGERTLHAPPPADMAALAARLGLGLP